MAKAPAFQLYTKDFLASESIALMEAEEIGWYILLLFHAWKKANWDEEAFPLLKNLTRDAGSDL